MGRPIDRAEQTDASDADRTPHRLLTAAATCFASRGYAGTSVRDITARARCNVSAVTYHFGGKRNVYVAVFEERLAELTGARISALAALGPAPPLEAVIETFATAFLSPLQGSRRGRETMTLLLREMVDGHLPGTLIAERMVRPTLDVLQQSLDRAVPGVDPQRMALCCHSLVSQLVHVLQVQRLHERGRSVALPPFDVAQTVSHIVHFTAAGIRASRAEARG
jgi:AcrR family transcriptional regulator